MQIWDKIAGTAKLKVTSADPTGTLRRIQKAGIRIYDVSYIDYLSIHFTIKRKDLSNTLKICERAGDSATIGTVNGLASYIGGLLKRPVIVLSFILWLALALWLPTRILFVTVQGENTLNVNYVLEQAAECGIRMGARGKEVRSERVKNALLSKIPTLRWVGVNTNGCIATISVNEKYIQNEKKPKVSLTDLVSTRDAIIKEITVQSGSALCTIGQAVSEGQALISCYRDKGEMLEFTGALGEIYGETKHHVQAVTPVQAYRRAEILSESQKSYIIIGKNPIFFWKDSGISDVSCVKMYDVRECKLPGGFALPIWLVTEHTTTYAVEPILLKEADCAWLYDYAQNYLQANLTAGSILSADTVGSYTNETYSVLGEYDCREMIVDYKYKGITQNNGEDG